jgi:maltose alpha-D-glucosyltransferase / alpha-amylase
VSEADHWYRDAIIYAIDVEKFADSNGDGRGDFVGLTQRLDYLHDLGVTCIWLLPFYPSPRKDNGYDVTDYYGVDPRFGTLEDFDKFVRLAGERGIRVVIDIVMDHTSDEHPWFQAARRDPGSRFRKYYTWTHMPPAGRMGHGSAFPGEESSLWKYDEMAGAYYYHPFYRFQPQLYMGNPEVRQELMRVLDFWMSFGVAGFRLDAVPLMLGLDGPQIDPPRDPHRILKDARELVQKRQPGTALLGEVDLDAGQLIGYFGDGDELNNLLNFQLNNYLFLALATERAAPVIRGLRLLPMPPEGCQWVNFLRNHDELNIQWLPEMDRAYVWEVFAPDPEARIYNRGIRRRLAPMINNPQKLEMAMSMLFSLPGTPMIMYGDEIGMGDDLSIPGRDAVRTPMQWSAGDNAGFSGAAPEDLVRPVIADGPFSYESVNVESQTGNPESLLEVFKRLTTARASCPEIGRGGWHKLETQHSSVLAYQVTWRDGVVVLIHNLGSEPVTQTIDLHDRRGERVRTIISNRQHLCCVEEKMYTIELEGYGYAWYRVIAEPAEERIHVY